MNINFFITVLSLLMYVSVKSQVLYDLNEIDDEVIVSNSLNNWKKKVEKVKVFGLGESTHNVGTTFKAKVSLIKFLHGSLDVDVIAFESGMYDCKKINDYLQITSDKSAKNFFRGLWGFWRSDEVKELYNYIVELPQSERPEVIGFDNQLLGYSKAKIADEFLTLCDTLNAYDKGVLTNDTLFFNLLKKAARYSNTYAKLSENDTTQLGEKLRKIETVIEINKLDTLNYFSFFKQISRGIRVDITRKYYPKVQMRDPMMYENLLWYIRKNPDKKIVIWAATNHLFYNATYVKDKKYHEISIGELLREELGEAYYVIAFTPKTGKGGWKETGIMSYKFKKPSKNSLEYAINEITDSSYALLPMKENVRWIEENNINKTKFFWRKEIEMLPYKICDAAFYIKEMSPPNYSIKENKK